MAARQPAMFVGPNGYYRHDPLGPLRRAGARGDVGLWAWGRDGYPGKSLQDTEYPGLTSAGLWKIVADQDWGLDWHLNEGLEITYVTHGRTAFSTEQEDRDIQRGWITVTRPWQRHRLGNPNVTACTLGWFVLDVGALWPNQPWSWPEWIPLLESDTQQLTEWLRGHERSVWPASNDLVQAIDRLEKAMCGESRRPLSRIAVGITDVLLTLMDVMEGGELEVDPYLSSTQRTVEVFLSGLRERIDEPWTIDRMADACGLGRTRFMHYCREAVNSSPIDYLNGLRMDHAARLLTTTDRSVTEITFECGFSSSQYLATVFKRQYNLSPTEARRKAQALSESA